MINAPHSSLLCNIAEHAISTPDKTAIVEGNNRISYSRLAGSIQRVAGYMCALGINRGDRVLLVAQKEVEFIYLYFASHLLGAVNVVVDASSPRERLDYIASVTKPVVAFGNDVDIDGCRCLPFRGVEAGSDACKYCPAKAICGR